MTLIDEAVRAEQIGDIFGRYRAANLEHVQTINQTIAELNSLSWSLREISTLLDETEYGDRLYLIEDDLKLVHNSVAFTLHDVWLIIGSISQIPGAPLLAEDFRRNWLKILRYCHDTGEVELPARLNTYKRFLLGLRATLKTKNASTQEFGALRRTVREVAPPAVRKQLKDTVDELVDDFQNLGVQRAGSRPQKQRSYERHRNEATSPSESGSSSSPWAVPPQPVPSPPTSPTNTFSSLSQISSIEREKEHWVKHVFRDIPSFTPLPDSAERSKYHDYPGQPNQEEPNATFESVLALGFPPDPPALRVTLFHRSRDSRAKIAARWRDRKGRPCDACLPLDILEVYRMGPMLHLCRRVSDRQTWMWLSLKFTTLERLVLFHGAFLSMRARDTKKPVRPVDDAQLADEEVEYAGKIRENNYGYALYVYRDKESKAVRLQASIRGGPMDKTPVWTGFITHLVTSKTWCQRLDRTKVCLRELQPRIYSHDYEFQRMGNGAFVLDFESRDDTKDFMACVEDVGRDLRRSR